MQVITACLSEPYLFSELSVCKKYQAEGHMHRKQLSNIFNTSPKLEPWNVTFVTQMTLSRFDRLDLVAKHWQGNFKSFIMVEVNIM